MSEVVMSALLLPVVMVMPVVRSVIVIDIIYGDQHRLE